MPDTTTTAAPSIAYLRDDVGPEQGQVHINQMTDDASPVVVVQLPAATASSDAPQAGDTVAVVENGATIGQSVLTAGDLAQGFVDVVAASGLSTSQNQILQAQVIDIAGNASALSAGFTVDLAPASGVTRTSLTDGGYVLSYSGLGGPAQTHLQRYDPAGEPVGAEIDYTGFGFYSGFYSVTPLAGGAYLALFFSGPHYGSTSGEIVESDGQVLAQQPAIVVSGQAQAAAGPEGGFVIYGTPPLSSDGVFTLYNNVGVAQSGQLELAGMITSVTPGAGGNIDINWNDAGTLRTLSIDPRVHSTLANPTAAPAITVVDDAGPQTGPVPDGGTTDDTTPTLRIAVSQTGEAYVRDGSSGAVLSTIHVDGADVARGYAEFTPDLGAGGFFLASVRVSDANGLASPSSRIGFFVEAPGQTLQGRPGGSSLQGGAGDDTLIGGTGPDSMTGDGGADHFVFQAVPWIPGHVTDFTAGTDKLDLSSLLAGAHYAGSDPIADGYVKLIDDGRGDSWVYFDSDGRASGDRWGSFVTTLDHVSPSQVTAADLGAGGPPPSPPPPGGAGQVLQGGAGGSHLTGGSGDDTLIGGTGPDVMAGAGGADEFVFRSVPWLAAEITDFTHGADKLDLTALLAAAHYTGADPVADGYVKFLDNGSGGTWLYFDSDGRGSGDAWGSFVATLDRLAASGFTTADLGSGSDTSSPPPPVGQTLHGQGGGSNLNGSAGDDTLIGGTGPDTMTGAGGADHFVWSQLPWAGGQLTDFTEGVDKIDLSGVLASVHYAGSDPIADGFVRLFDDGQGGAWLYFDTDGHGSADQWGSFVTTLKGVAPSSLSGSDFIF